MNLDQARALLGISADATELEIRRAYMRKIKVYKPETDPEGFKRLRDAYELARMWISATASEDDPRSTEPEAINEDVESMVADGRADEVPADLIIEYALDRFTAGEREPAVSILLMWFAAASRHGLLNTASDEVTLLAVQELGRLPPETPAAFVQAMARGLQTHDLDAASETIVELTREDPRAAEALRMHLFPYAPVLRGLFRKALRGQGPVERISYWLEDRPWTKRAAVTIAIVAFILLRACAR